MGAIVNNICRQCGEEFTGSSHSWYCDKCREVLLRERKEKELKRIKSNQYERICVICGNTFYSYFKKETCSTDCEKILRSDRMKGRNVKDITKKKIAKKNSRNWHLISPEGNHYRFQNLKQWARENSELFGFEKNEEYVSRIVVGISQAKRGKIVNTYKGWKVVNDPAKFDPKDIVDLYKNGNSINKIHKLTGKSISKIRKLLITKGLWEDELSKKVSDYLHEGKTEEEIANILHVSKKVVNSRCPYTKGMYEWEPSLNAQRIKKCRQNKKSNSPTVNI